MLPILENTRAAVFTEHCRQSLRQREKPNVFNPPRIDGAFRIGRF